MDISSTPFPNLRIQDEFQPISGTITLGRRLYLFQSLESTNDTAYQLALEGAPEGALVVAGEQTHGRGRSGHAWFSEEGSGLYLSLILRPQIRPQLAPILSLAAALSVHQSILAISGLAADIKWPNDLLINHKKCAGILLELYSERDEIKHLVLGIGINVNNGKFPSELAGLATSLSLETGRHFRRDEVLQAVIEHFEPVYERFLAGGSAKIVEAWKTHSSFAEHRKVWIELGGKTVTGMTTGVSVKGALRVRLENGQVEELISGDIVRWE